ncbi:Uncharacterised protein [Raoultella planticola]|uniref:Uncharacterized protein n=1 Tax=Raoultella planticola TaxID=575 RepID=A0A485AD49_RAOPL|nr:Uncharacterised protein [Raoultella planticola]
MKLKLRYDHAHGYLNTQRDLRCWSLTVLYSTERLIRVTCFPQLDTAVILEWLSEQGYVITHRERAA